jgi:hypothetical protein
MEDFILGSWHLVILLITILFVTFQLVKWRDLLIFWTYYLYKMHSAFVCVFFFWVTFFNKINFLCFLLMLLLFGNYDKKIQNFDNSFEFTPCCLYFQKKKKKKKKKNHVIYRFVVKMFLCHNLNILDKPI